MVNKEPYAGIRMRVFLRMILLFRRSYLHVQLALLHRPYLQELTGRSSLLHLFIIFL